MRISNVEWLKKRIASIRKQGEKTARQRQIIDLLDDKASLSELLHILATAEKMNCRNGMPGRKTAGNAITNCFWRLD